MFDFVKTSEEDNIMKKEDKKLYIALILLIFCIATASVIVAIRFKSDNIVSFMTDSSPLQSVDESEHNDIFPADLNIVTENELMLIDGIGSKTAKAIIMYRTKNGEFRSVNELIKVDGIGEKTLFKLKDYLYVKNDDNSFSSVSEESSTTAQTKKVTDELIAPIDINTAPKSELIKLSGIGNDRADAIIKFRQKTPFYDIQDIKKVNGIGEQIYSNIKDKIYVDTSKLPQMTTTVPQTQTTPPETTVTTPEITETNKLNINTATREDFLNLDKGISNAIVDKILEFRDTNKIKFTNILMLTYFMPTSVYNRIRDRITI